MIKGGYIELVTQDNNSKSLQYLRDLVQLVIYKDIVKVFGIRNPKNMEDLLLYLASHSSELFSESNLSSKMGIRIETISDYLRYLEEVFLINTCRIFAPNRAKQLRKPKKVFINDNGIRNMLSGTFSSRIFTNSEELGHIAETIVQNHLRRLAFYFDTYNAQCLYWKNEREVDNVIVYGRKAIPIEVKYQNSITSDDVIGLLDFQKEYKNPFGILITKNKLNLEGDIISIPLWYFLLIC